MKPNLCPPLVPGGSPIPSQMFMANRYIRIYIHVKSSDFFLKKIF